MQSSATDGPATIPTLQLWNVCRYKVHVCSFWQPHIFGCRRSLCSDNFYFAAAKNAKHFCSNKINFATTKTFFRFCGVLPNSYQTCSWKSNLCRQNPEPIFLQLQTFVATKREGSLFCLLICFLSPHIWLGSCKIRLPLHGARLQLQICICQWQLARVFDQGRFELTRLLEASVQTSFGMEDMKATSFGVKEFKRSESQAQRSDRGKENQWRLQHGRGAPKIPVFWTLHFVFLWLF